MYLITLLLIMLLMHTVSYCCVVLGIKLLLSLPICHTYVLKLSICHVASVKLLGSISHCNGIIGRVWFWNSVYCSWHIWDLFTVEFNRDLWWPCFFLFVVLSLIYTSLYPFESTCPEHLMFNKRIPFAVMVCKSTIDASCIGRVNGYCWQQ